MRRHIVDVSFTNAWLGWEEISERESLSESEGNKGSEPTLSLRVLTELVSEFSGTLTDPVDCTDDDDR